MQAGQTIAGKYRLNRVIGTGGMASVWSATNVFTEREFAIKFMLPQVARTPEAVRRFLLEAKVSGRINHPHIIEIIDVGQAEDGSLFLVMELLQGTSLDVLVRRSTPPLLIHEFLAIMRDVASALAAAHRSGVIHRDLKPTNVFLHKDRDGRRIPKVLDFGVSKVIEEGNDSLTVVGTILGSPLYMSPEQAMGAEGIDGRTDVFAFGAILFEALCAQRAYHAANLNALIVAIATTPPKSIDDLAPKVPESVRALVRDCMVTDKSKRVASFDVIVERLDGILLELAGSDLRLPAPVRRGDPTPEPPPVADVVVGVDPASSPLHAGTPSSRWELGSPPPVSTTGARARSGTSSTPAWLPSARTLATRTGGTWGIAAGAAVVVCLGIAALFRSGGDPRPRAVALAPEDLPSRAATGASAASARPAPPSTSESSDVPVISVDSLPVAAHSAAARAKSNGKLTVAATPGWCTVTVDGVPRGVTPLPSLEIPAGVHQVECAPPGGQPHAATVTVAEGTEAHYQFALAQ